MQFHVLSFEGPDAYARAGGIATRVEGLTQALAAQGAETHLWFIGDPEEPGDELRGSVNLHRWAQWVSRYHPGGVYDGELGKASELARSLPPHLMQEFLTPHISEGGRTVVLAEEWQTVDAVLHLDYLLRAARVRDRVSILWNANNSFGFHRIPWDRLAEAAIVTTVSRYMKHQMRGLGVDPLVIPNGLSGDADVVNLHSHVDASSRPTLFRAMGAVLANSGHEPFGLVGLEAMAAGGIACTGCSGEDYAVPGQNALVLETGEPREFVGLFERLRSNPSAGLLLRRSAQSTARRYRWEDVATRVLLPRIQLLRAPASTCTEPRFDSRQARTTL